jgi:hypothetical protein
MALVRHGLVINRIEEHPWTVWQRFSWLVAGDDGIWTLPPGIPQVPLTFTLVATKQA